MSVPVNQAQIRLAGLWIGLGVVCGLTLAWQILFAHVFAENEVDDARNWLLTLLVPFITLIASSVAAEARHQSTAEVSDLAYKLALVISGIFLVAIICVLWAATWSDGKPIATLKGANVWLTILQGLVGIMMGVFFTQEKKSPSSPPGPALRHGTRPPATRKSKIPKGSEQMPEPQSEEE